MGDIAKYKTGEIIWRDLTVKNAGELKTFYESVIGWKTTPHNMGDYDDYVVMLPEKNKDGGEDAVAGICYTRGSNSKIPPQWLMYVWVEDLFSSIERCKNLGGEIIDEPRKMGEDNFCVIKDPEGAVIALMSK